MQILRVLCIVTAYLLPSLALAQGRGITPNFFVDTQFALTTNKSKMVLSNDTGTALRYGLGCYAGSDRQFAFFLMNDKDTTSFALNESSIAYSWQDTSIRYNLGGFYLGALFTQLAMEAENAGVETIDASGSGMGVVAGYLMGIGKTGSLHLDIATATLPELKNALPQTVAVGQRLDIDIGASIGLTAKLLDFTFGYRTRTMTIKADASYAEALYQTYAGLRMKLYF